jgi:hypothetical protein
MLSGASPLTLDRRAGRRGVAHRRQDHVRGQDVQPLRALFAGAVVAWRIADGPRRGPGRRARVSRLARPAALALWAATIGLVGIGARTRDRVIRSSSSAARSS